MKTSILYALIGLPLMSCGNYSSHNSTSDVPADHSVPNQKGVDKAYSGGGDQAVMPEAKIPKADQQIPNTQSADSRSPTKAIGTTNGQTNVASHESPGTPDQMKDAVRQVLNGPQGAKLNSKQKDQINLYINGACDQAISGQKVDSQLLFSHVLTSLNLNPTGNPLPGGANAGNLGNIGGLGNIGDLINIGKIAGGADLAKAITDLVNAAQNADVAGILKAVQDIVGAAA